MTEPIVILGAGLFGDQIARVIRTAAADRYHVAGFVDDAADAPVNADAPLFGPWSAFAGAFDPAAVRLALGVGYRNLEARLSVLTRARDAGFRFASLVHPAAHVAADAVVEDGALVMAGASVDVGARIGAGSFIDLNVSVCERTTLGAANYVSAGAAIGGNARLGDANFLGLNAIVTDAVTVGDFNRVPAGGLVCRDLSDRMTVMEARTIRAIPAAGAPTP